MEACPAAPYSSDFWTFHARHAVVVADKVPSSFCRDHVRRLWQDCIRCAEFIAIVVERAYAALPLSRTMQDEHEAIGRETSPKQMIDAHRHWRVRQGMQGRPERFVEGVRIVRLLPDIAVRRAIADLMHYYASTDRSEATPVPYDRLADRYGTTPREINEALERLAHHDQKWFDVNLPIGRRMASIVRPELLERISRHVDSDLATGGFSSLERIFEVELTPSDDVADVLAALLGGWDSLVVRRLTTSGKWLGIVKKYERLLRARADQTTDGPLGQGE